MALGQLLSSATSAQVGAMVGLLAAYTLYGAIWRLYLSPIAHIPGPRLAALTWWYEFYYDIVLGGQYVFKMVDLHKQYGPIIRINPYEVHINDPDFHPHLYPTSNRRRDRWAFFTKQFGADGSGVGTIDHSLHKLRRAPLNPFFSLQSVRALQPVLDARVSALLARLRADGLHRRRELNILYPFSALTNDIINLYAFSRSDDLLSLPDYGRAVTDHLLTGTHHGKTIQHLPLLLPLIAALPSRISSALVPGWAGFLEMKRTIHAQIADIQRSPPDKWDALDHPTIFHTLLASPLLPPEEKTLTRLAHEGQVLVQAGTLTASWTLAVATFHLLDQPQILARLRDELEAAMPDPEGTVSLAELDQLPVLRAVVKETLRHSLGAAGRSARVCPDERLVFVEKGPGGRRWVVPEGVAVGMTGFMTVNDAEIFPEPERFRAERWLEGTEEERRELERHWTAVWGGGGRMCLGMWLARGEVTLALARLWRVWGGEERRRGDVGRMRLAEGVEARDARMAADFFIPIPWKGTRGIRVVLETFE